MNNFQKQIQTRRGKSKKPRIAWILTDWAANPYREANDLYGGIGYYRVILPSRYLRKDFDIEVIGAEFRHWGTIDETYTRLGRDYDLIICKHLLDGQTASNILATAKHFKRKVILDLDDDYFHIRKDTPAYKDYESSKDGKYVTTAFLELADGIIVSTDPLKKLYEKYNKNIHVLPNCNDVKEWPERKQWDDGKIRIGFAGGVEHNNDLDLLCEPIGKILNKYENVTFEVIGAVGAEKARDMGARMLKFANHKILDRFRITGGTQAWLGYPELLAAQGWDIGLAPLVDDEFNRSKSHIKWMEYSSVGAATIASPVYPFKEPINGVNVIEHGVTGLFASTADEWFQMFGNVN